MLYWIFDLDHTLYNLSKRERFSYSKLGKNTQLNAQLYLLPCIKILFTNGTVGHAVTSLKKIGIYDHFKGRIFARDNLNAMKPNMSAYEKLMHACGISQNDKVVFFEDSVENLITAKNYNWITILICQKRCLLAEVDFCFSNVNIALNFFLSEISKNRNKKKLLNR